jgi:tRNA G18 (ribose-2'-O)-methylase SpoU
MRKISNEELNRISVDQFKVIKKFPIVLILDNIRSMYNVGSVFRSADAFLVEEIALCGITAKPPHREINKTALGATDTVKWSYFDTTIQAIGYYQSKNYRLVAIEQVENGTSLQDFQPVLDQPYAFIFGNEVFGVEQEIVNLADDCLEIPQFGTKHSLNISVSVGILLWDYLSKIKIKTLD